MASKTGVMEPVTEELRLSFHEMLDLLVEVEQGASDAFDREVAENVRHTVRAKMGNYQRFISFCKGMAGECATEIQRLQRRKAAIEAAEKRVRTLIAYNMDAFGIKKIDAGTCVFSLVQGKMSLDITDEEAVPREFKREVVTYVIESERLKAALTALTGDERIPGAQLHEGHPFITIR